MIIDTLATLRAILVGRVIKDGKTIARLDTVDERGHQRRLWLAQGPIDGDQPLVAWQRRDRLLALATPAAEPGRYQVAAAAPFSLATAHSILSHAGLIHMDDPVGSMDAARASSGRTGAFYSCEADRVTIIDWDLGLAQTRLGDGEVGACPRPTCCASPISHRISSQAA